MIIHGNDIDLFYEKAGSGPPLILLHGNGEDHHIFDRLAAELAGRFTVYCLDTRGHGGSSKVREFHYQDMADDVVSFIAALGLEHPGLCGFSDGGIVGLLVASQYSELLAWLVVSGANLDPTGLKKLPHAAFKAAYFFSRGPKLKLLLTEPDIREADLKQISIPVCVTAGSRDLIREEHTKKIAEAIQGSILRILPGETHSSYVVHSTKLLSFIEEAASNNEQ